MGWGVSGSELSSWLGHVAVQGARLAEEAATKEVMMCYVSIRN